MGETPEKKRADELRALVQEAQSDGLSQASIAKQAGLSPSALNQWLKEAYKGDNTAIEMHLEGWVESCRDRELMPIPQSPDWVTTPTGERIINALSYAHSMGDIAVVYGGAGVGKTSALKHYQSIRPNVWLVTISPATSTAPAALEEIAYALGNRTPPIGAARIKRDVVRRINGTRGLLVIDESQHLSVIALECIRSLHDEIGIGLVLSGNEMVYSRLTGGNRSATFAQLFSRVGKRVHLTSPSTADVAAVANGWSVEGKRERRLLEKIAASPGALRGVTKTLRLASVLALGDKPATSPEDTPALTYRLIEAAWRDLGGFDHTGGARKQGR